MPKMRANLAKALGASSSLSLLGLIMFCYFYVSGSCLTPKNNLIAYKKKAEANKTSLLLLPYTAKLYLLLHSKPYR